MWTFRRNEHDVVNLYNSLSPLMQLATGGSMLNFGYWSKDTKNPLEAQQELCKIIAKLANLDSAKTILDVGSGLSAPATHWKSMYEDIQISCVNINFQQLNIAKPVLNVTNFSSKSLVDQTNGISFVNATSTKLPFSNHCMDRIIALESAQHFKPLSDFIQESKRVLKHDGILVIAIPVITGKERLFSFMKLGILSITWSSEHYGLELVKSTITKGGFQINRIEKIGANVYEPLTDYYIKNRDYLRQIILKKYPSYLENVLYKSLLKMKQVSQKDIIEYVLIQCIPV